jgi:hypothetical protein
MDLLRELQQAQEQVTGTWAYAPEEEWEINMWEEEQAPIWDEGNRIRQAVSQGSQGMLVPNLTPNMW